MRAQRGSWRRDAAPQMRTGPAGPVVWSAGPLRRLERLEVHGGLLAVAAALEVEADLLALIEGGHAGTLDGRDMDKRILAAIGRLDETVTLGGIEEFDDAFGHLKSSARRIPAATCQPATFGLLRSSMARGPQQRETEAMRLRTDMPRNVHNFKTNQCIPPRWLRRFTSMPMPAPSRTRWCE